MVAVKPTWNWNHHRVSQRLGERNWLRRVWADQSEQGIWEGALKRQELKKSVSDRATEHNEACCKLSYRNNHFLNEDNTFINALLLDASTAASMSSENHCVVVYVIDSGKKQSLPNRELLTWAQCQPE